MVFRVFKIWGQISLLLLWGLRSVDAGSRSSKIPSQTAVTPETRQIDVLGRAEITEAGDQDAYDRALEHGLRKAVEEVLGILIDARTLVENSVLIEDRIYAKSSGYVQKYRVLEETQEGRTKKLLIEAWVLVAEIKDDAMALEILQSRVGLPRLMIWIQEETLEGKPRQRVKTALQKGFLEKQFRLVEIGDGPPGDVASDKKGLLEQLSEMAALMGADVVVWGRVSSREQQISHFEGTGFKSVSSTIEVEIYHAGDGSLILSDAETRPGAMPNLEGAQGRSLELAAEILVPRVVDKVIREWENRVNRGFEYQVRISGLSFEQSKQIKSSLSKNIEGVKELQEKHFSEGRLTLSLRYTGRAAELAGFLVLPRKVSPALKMISYNAKVLNLEVLP